MINYHTFRLNNGLRVIVHPDPSTPMAVVNVLYDVGARDEDPNKTGFAHLFEHLMFGGSVNIPSYDKIIHNAGGNCNAFTGSDITNYFNALPANNLETALWLESDRMFSLNFSEESLKVQKDVVCEEFKENCINRPYGDAWHTIRALSYKKHPYQWPVIGKKVSHIENATLGEVKDFFFRYYRPNNAILSIAGGVSLDKAKALTEKWFAGIPTGPPNARQLPVEEPQQQIRRQTVQANVPLDALYMNFHMCKRTHPDYYAIDLLCDILSTGQSSRLFQELVKQRQLFSHIDAHVLGNFDEGLFSISGKLSQGANIEQGEQAVWEVLQELCDGFVHEHELQKAKNKVESAIIFSETSLWQKAYLLAYYELLGNIDLVNNETEHYTNVHMQDIKRVANSLFRPNNCTVLHYLKKQEVPTL